MEGKCVNALKCVSLVVCVVLITCYSLLNNDTVPLFTFKSILTSSNVSLKHVEQSTEIPGIQRSSSEKEQLGRPNPYQRQKILSKAHVDENTRVDKNSDAQENSGSTVCRKRTVRLSRTPLPVTGLVSFPGSGNTWVRHLIQQMTGNLKCIHIIVEIK